MSIWGNPVMLGKSGGGGLHGDMPPTSDIGSDGDIYTQVYTDSTLTGDGASYIDTGIYPTSRHSFQVHFALSQIDETNYPCIVAVRNGRSAYWMMRFNATASTSNSRSVSIAKQDSPTGSQQWYDSTTLKQDDFVDTYHLLSMGFDLSSMNLYYAEDGSIKHTYGTSGNSNSWSYTWWMFACNNANTLQSGSVAKMILKYCKMWDQNENLIAYFVPYLDGNTPCVLNLVTGTKHYNLGTGDFTYTATGGNKVGLVWLKENGAWSIIGHS